MTHMKKREGRIGKNYEKYYRSEREQLYNTKFWTILTHFIGLSQSFAVSGYLFLSLAILGYIWLSRAVSRYLWLFSMFQASEGLESRSWDWRYRDSWFRLGLVQNFWTGLVSVSSWMKNFETVSSRSRLVCFHFTQSRLGLVLTRMCSFQRN